MSVYRFDGSINSAGLGQACEGVEIFVLTQPANTTVFPPTPLATIYTDSTGAHQLPNPVISDGNGNFFFYAAAGIYTLYYHDPFGRIPDEVFPDQAVTTQGGGTVTSVGLTMPAEFAVAGSPVIAAGTLAVTKVTQNANKVYAGPTTGADAVPVFRNLVAADLPGGTGTISSITLTVAVPGFMTQAVTGSPLTANGTLAITLGFANQNPNAVLAGPATGSPAAPTFRLLQGSDFAGLVAVTFSATPVFDASSFAFPVFTMTLTADVTSSSVTNPTNGERIVFKITQDGVGGHAFAWPTNFRGASSIGPNANDISIQEFFYDGTNWRALSPGIVTNS